MVSSMSLLAGLSLCIFQPLNLLHSIFDIQRAIMDGYKERFKLFLHHTVSN